MWFSFISSPSTRLAEGSLLLHHPLRTPWAANKRLQLHSLLDEARLLIYQVSDLVLKMISMNKTILDSWCTLRPCSDRQPKSVFYPIQIESGWLFSSLNSCKSHEILFLQNRLKLPLGGSFKSHLDRCVTVWTAPKSCGYMQWISSSLVICALSWPGDYEFWIYINNYELKVWYLIIWA